MNIFCLFTISFSKSQTQLRSKEQSALENRFKILESNVSSNKMLQKNNKCKNKLEEIYEKIARGVKVRKVKGFLKRYSQNLCKNHYLKLITSRSCSKQEVTDVLESFSNDKSRGNGSLTKEFQETYWSEIKEPFMNSISQSKIST